MIEYLCTGIVLLPLFLGMIIGQHIESVVYFILVLIATPILFFAGVMVLTEYGHNQSSWFLLIGCSLLYFGVTMLVATVEGGRTLVSRMHQNRREISGERAGENQRD